jgi:hypothetical protein
MFLGKAVKFGIFSFFIFGIQSFPYLTNTSSGQCSSFRLVRYWRFLQQKSKKNFYLNKYRPFYNQLEAELKSSDPRDLDRALWKFGQFLKWLKPPTENEADENSEWQSTA